MEDKVKIRDMQRSDIPRVAEVLGRAYATNPIILATYRGKGRVARRIQTNFESMFKYASGKSFVAELDSRVLGGFFVAKWPACQAMSLKMMLPALRAVGGLGPLVRGMQWQRACKKRDPRKPHWHLKMIGVDPDFQGKGIGGQMMDVYCGIIDGSRLEAHHETDRSENVPFYERYGFKVVGEEMIIGVKNWYMLRPAKSDK
jgi:ribosomal protein S18 acetylase RimI-like enzyme